MPKTFDEGMYETIAFFNTAPTSDARNGVLYAAMCELEIVLNDKLVKALEQGCRSETIKKEIEVVTKIKEDLLNGEYDV